ncbi:hypothetical protein [Candidatus Hodarchaeum mangrovi]
MGNLTLAWKNISRNPQRSRIFIFTHSLSMATGGIFFLLSKGLYSEVSSFQIKFNISILNLMTRYLEFTQFFALLSSISIASVLASLLTVSQMDDFSVLSALGGTFKKIQRIPLTNVLLINCFSVLLGAIEGLIGGLIFQILLGFNINLTIGKIIDYFIFVAWFFFLSIAGTYLISGFLINILIKRKFQELALSQYAIESNSDQRRILGISTKKKPAFLLGYLFQKRFRLISRVVIFGILTLSLISSFGLLGGSIIQETSNEYINHGFSSDVIIITPSLDLSILLKDLYNPFNRINFNFSMKISSESISEQFIKEIQEENSSYEKRWFSLGYIYFIPGINYEDIWTGAENTTFPSYFWVIDEISTIFQYYSWKLPYDSPPEYQPIIIGDGWKYLVRKNTITSLIPKQINGIDLSVKRFEIEKTVIDPFAKGHSIFLWRSSMLELYPELSVNFTNVLFVKNPTRRVYTLIENYNLHWFSLEPFKQLYHEDTRNYWFYSNLAFTPVFVSAFLSLSTFLVILCNVLNQDLSIIRAVGGRNLIIQRILLWIIIFLSSQGFFYGIILGFSTSYSLIISNPAFPALSSWLVLFGASIIVGLAIYLYVKQLAKKII